MIRLSQQYENINHFRKQIPVDVEGLSEALGVPIHRAYLDDDISGMIEAVKDDEYQITVNARHPKTRQRFTIAHELGHYMLHRHLIGDGIDDDRAYRSTNVGKYHNMSIGPEEETEANRFAAGLLMPKESIQKLRAEGMTPIQMAERLQVSAHAMHIKLGVPYNA